MRNLITIFGTLFAIVIVVSGFSKFNQKQHSGTIRFNHIQVKAPFRMPELLIPIFPEKLFKITDFGATEGGRTKNTESIQKAIQACAEAGGGQVILPAGKWLTGQIHLKSNVNFHLDEGAELFFSDNPEDYLPAVQSSWEGIECFNYSPLIYAYECNNVALTGKGTIIAKLDTWKTWYERPPAHLKAIEQLYNMAAKEVPVIERQMAVGENHLRPQFIQFNRCNNLLIEDISIQNSPFWTVHILLCEGVVVRGIKVNAHGHNNDGLDPEMTRNMLVENCIFDQGDDAIAIKSGRDKDGWRLNKPCENIVIRNCTVKNGHQMVAIGSELSSGVRNVYVHDCQIDLNDSSMLNNVLFIKTNEYRGGFVENIYVENIEADKTSEGILKISTDVVYQYKNMNLLLTKRLTRIQNISINNVKVIQTNIPVTIIGDKEMPVRNIRLDNVSVKSILDMPTLIENAENVKGKLKIGSEIITLKIN